MFSLNSDHRYYLYKPVCDMRKSFEGLCGLVRNELGKNPCDGSVYLFLNRSRTHLKLLHWEAGGFVLYYKRLERGCFELPNTEGVVRWSDLVLMVEGIVVNKQIRRLRYDLNV